MTNISGGDSAYPVNSFLRGQVEKLPTSQRKQIVQILDAFLEREKLKARA